MVKVVYIGVADTRELSVEDLAALGVERKQGHTFIKGVPEEVANAVGDAILSHPGVAGEFIEFQVAEEMGAVVEPDTSGLVTDPNAGEETRVKKTKSSTSTGTASGGGTPGPSSGSTGSSGSAGSA